jgi:hypothetical protein
MGGGGRRGRERILIGLMRGGEGKRKKEACRRGKGAVPPFCLFAERGEG